MIKETPNINKYTAWKRREKWFTDRIGKTIYRPPLSCKCESCINGHIHGITIADHEHAIYLHSCESEMSFRYSDKKLPN